MRYAAVGVNRNTLEPSNGFNAVLVVGAGAAGAAGFSAVSGVCIDAWTASFATVPGPTRGSAPTASRELAAPLG